MTDEQLSPKKKVKKRKSSAATEKTRGKPDDHGRVLSYVVGVFLLLLGGGMIVGKLVSKSSRSGNRSTELILITGLPTSLRLGSETGWGKHQLSPNSDRTRALPTNPMYLSKGI